MGLVDSQRFEPKPSQDEPVAKWPIDSVSLIVCVRQLQLVGGAVLKTWSLRSGS